MINGYENFSVFGIRKKSNEQVKFAAKNMKSNYIERDATFGVALYRNQ